MGPADSQSALVGVLSSDVPAAAAYEKMSVVADRLWRVPESEDGAAVRRWCAAGLDALRRHRSEIDALNVYPVPDGDTGTNLTLTMSAAVDAVDAAPSTLGAADLLSVAARGALLGARGNSGIILAQLLKGLASSLASAPTVGGSALAAALGSACLL